MIEKNFASVFIRELDQQDWYNLHDLFRTTKVKASKRYDLYSLDAEFPQEVLEKETKLVGYLEIFPYAQNITLVTDDGEYVFEDYYCINPECRCTEVLFRIYPAEGTEDVIRESRSAVQYNYRERVWLTEKEPANDSYAPDILMVELRKTVPTLDAMLKKRHHDLRFLYRKYKHKLDEKE
jgi:hypothetical protein